jgi:hypothetical protein
MIKVVSHSQLFYWWPVWAISFLFGVWTLIDGHYMVSGSGVPEVIPNAQVEMKEGRDIRASREVVVFTSGVTSSRIVNHGYTARNRSLGLMFCVVLLVVIIVTSVPRRGRHWGRRWVGAIVLGLAASLLLALTGRWAWFVERFPLLDIRINATGYFLIAGSLFLAWLLTVVVFDQRIYIVFTPGQFRICAQIGDGERVFDTIGISLERQSGDLFRHRILGLGSGDLVVRTTGAQQHHFDMPNVLFIDKKMRAIEEVLRNRSNRNSGW